ncbi:hypothetical protein HLV35_06760 [Eggerthellaceae bacterium zg-997]|nr:hypothetical protein [Eggerthellaceae bacterium zg-997]
MLVVVVSAVLVRVPLVGPVMMTRMGAMSVHLLIRMGTMLMRLLMLMLATATAAMGMPMLVHMRVLVLVRLHAVMLMNVGMGVRMSMLVIVGHDVSLLLKDQIRLRGKADHTPLSTHPLPPLALSHQHH